MTREERRAWVPPNLTIAARSGGVRPRSAGRPDPPIATCSHRVHLRGVASDRGHREPVGGPHGARPPSRKSGETPKLSARRPSWTAAARPSPRSRSAHAQVLPHRQRRAPGGRRAAGHAAALGPARRAGPHRHQVRVRQEPVRGVHRPHGRIPRALVHDTHVPGGRPRDHHHRGSRRRSSPRSRRRGSRRACPSAGTASPARSWRPRRSSP